MNKFPFIVAIVVLLFLTWHSASTGYAAWLTESALQHRDLNAAQTAARLSPADPHAQVVYGVLLEASDDRPAAMPHYQTAVKLRPDDYVLRMQLARGQELEGDTSEAINSATTAVALAPAYAQTHWQLGNILVRAGRRDDGFAQLRLAGASSPQLWPSIVDLAWQVSAGQVKDVEQAVAPNTPDAYKALAAYLKKRGLVAEAIHWLQAGGAETREERRNFTAELIVQKKFIEASKLWEFEHPPDAKASVLSNPDFEQEADLDEPGFGWRTVSPDKLITPSLDSVNPKAGRSSLRLDFNGAQNSASEIISQLVIVLPNTRGRLTFAYRTGNIVSGGMPYLTVVDATSEAPLGNPEVMPASTDGWRDGVIDFTTGPATTAIRISLKRQPCPAQQCPIFGKLWLDDFVLK